MKMFLYAALAFGFCSFSHAQEHAAVTTVRSLYAQIYSAVNEADAATKQSAYCGIAASSIDYPALADGLAGRYYTEAQPEHQAHFNQSLQRMLVSTFTQYFAGLNTQIQPEISDRVVKKSSRVQVQTKVPYNNDYTNINFVMREDANGVWRIADAYVSGMSLISQKYPEFKNGIDGYKTKYLDPLNRYATDMESLYPACY